MPRFSVESVFKAVDRVTAPVTRMQNRVGKFTRSMQRELRAVNRTMDTTVSGIKTLSGAVVRYGAIGIGTATAAVGLLVREFSKVENAEAAFNPLLGSAERARQAVEAINETAATTPFQFETLAGSVNQLLPVMNGNIENTIMTLRMLGDTAGGNAQKLESITRGFTQAMRIGKVGRDSLNMIADAGVPIYQELAHVMGTEVNEEFFKMISAGKVGAEQLTRAFEKLTGEGGMFYKGMEIASKTTTGLWSTLKDNISLTAAELGGVLAPTIKDLIQQATGVAKRVREWVKANRELINTKFLEWVDVAKRVFSGLADAFDFLRKHGRTIAKVAGTVAALIVVLKVLAGVMAVVNLVMMANPVGLVVVAIGALIAAVAAAIIWWDEIKAAFLSLPDAAIVAVAALAGPVGWIIGAAALIYRNWGPVKKFFVNLWGDIVGVFDKAVAKITAVVDKIKSVARAIVDTAASVGGFVFGDDDGPQRKFDRRGRATVVSPQDRTARVIQEQRSISTAEVTIRDETRRAEVTRGRFGSSIRLQPTGAF